MKNKIYFCLVWFTGLIAFAMGITVLQSNYGINDPAIGILSGAVLGCIWTVSSVKIINPF